MAKRKVFDEEGAAHFVTFSCYKRRQLLKAERAKRIVIGVLGAQLVKRRGHCLGFVVMHDHVHVMLWFPEPRQLGLFMLAWKKTSSVRVKTFLREVWVQYGKTIDLKEPIWQRKYYDFNVFSEKKVREKLQYMHNNPVRSGLVKAPCDWLFSSARFYLQGKSVGVPVGLPG